MEVKNKILNIELSIDVINDEAIATIFFHNNSSDIIYLDVWTIGTHQLLTRSVFNIIDEDGNIIPYCGMMGSRAVTQEDFIALNPSENIQTKISINKDYKLIKGQKYVIQFCAYNPACPGKQPNIELWSNKVTIEY
jgi:hypothetical protein